MLEPAARALRLLGGLLIAAAVALPLRAQQASLEGVGIESVPHVETLDVARWPDLSRERRERLIMGALDAFDREGSAVVRALAVRLLSLAALHQPDRLLPELRSRAKASRGLFAEAGGDAASANLAFGAHSTWLMLDPESAGWIEPPDGLLPAALGHPPRHGPPDRPALATPRGHA